MEEKPKRWGLLDLESLRGSGNFFWILFIVVPLLTGMLAYRWDPGESFEAARDVAIRSHEVCEDNGETERCGEMVDEWRVKATGEIVSRGDFTEKRQREAARMAYWWFLYGLLGCYFFAFQKASDGPRSFTRLLVGAALVDSLVATFTYFSMRQ
jgi:hypothetical protein